MASAVPRHALRFTATAAKLAAKHGLKEGVTRAASKVNPVLLVIECVVSVADSVDSFLKLKNAKARRDGLREVLPYEEERLSLERKQLSEELDLAKVELSQNRQMQERLGKLVLLCGAAFSTTLDELQAIRTSDLPDLEAFDRQLEQLEDSWSDLRHALGNYSPSST